MAVLAAAQLLDELMGRNRNINPNEKTQKLNWEDPQVNVTMVNDFYSILTFLKGCCKHPI